jgi:hypothetical protein
MAWVDTSFPSVAVVRKHQFTRGCCESLRASRNSSLVNDLRKLTAVVSLSIKNRRLYFLKRLTSRFREFPSEDVELVLVNRMNDVNKI